MITAAKPTNFTDFFSNLIFLQLVDVVTSSFDVPFDGFDTGVLLTASGISNLTINNEEFTNLDVPNPLVSFFSAPD